LPRGPFGSYLRAHYLSEQGGRAARFTMGRGAIFMIQRVRPLAESLSGPDAVAETDPLLLSEMVALVIAQGLDVIALDEIRDRLAARECSKRFVSFTFDGAYKATLANAAALFRDRKLPFAVYVAADYLDNGRLPWWIALEELVARSPGITLEIDGKPQLVSCRSVTEKREAFASLHRLMVRLPAAERRARIETLCHAHAIDIAALAAREMIGPAELTALSGDPLITIGGLAGAEQALAELSYDEAEAELRSAVDRLEGALGVRPKHLAFSGALPGGVGAREFKLAAALGLETAVTGIEGALWPEHAGEPFALPRIALDNDPATLVRALMLSGGTPFGLAREEHRARA
jgi:peptidoglycan/xylan/chitin deacetylase (PgdA/CDA1 family)